MVGGLQLFFGSPVPVIILKIHSELQMKTNTVTLCSTLRLLVYRFQENPVYIVSLYSSSCILGSVSFHDVGDHNSPQRSIPRIP